MKKGITGDYVCNRFNSLLRRESRRAHKFGRKFRKHDLANFKTAFVS